MSDQLKTAIGNFIKGYKEEHNLTYKQLSEVNGVSVSQLGKLVLLGGEGVSLDTTFKAIEELGFTIAIDIKPDEIEY